MNGCPREVEFAERLTETEARSKSNTHRLDKLEETTEAINSLAVSMKEMATEQKNMSKSVDKLTGDVETLKAEPGKRWKFVIEKAIYFVVAAIMGFIMARAGLS